MTSIRLSNSGGDRNFATPATWDGGVAPGQNDVIIADSSSGNLINPSGSRPIIRGFDLQGYAGNWQIDDYITSKGINGQSFDCHFGSGMTFSGTNYLYFANSAVDTIINLYSHGVTVTGPNIRLSASRLTTYATLVLQDALTLTSTFAAIGSGAFRHNGYTLTCANMNLSSSAGGYLDLQFGDVYLTGTSNILNGPYLTEGQFSANNIYITNTSAAGKTILAPNNNIGNVIITGTGSGLVNFANYDTTVNDLVINYPKTVTITSGKTLYVMGDIRYKGVQGSLIVFKGAQSGQQGTISKASGVVDLDWWSIKDCIATGGAQFYAGSHSTNGGNNSGWIFADAPVGVPIAVIRRLLSRAVQNASPFGG